MDDAGWPRRVVVVGAGAMGSTFGAAFAHAGYDVELIDRRGDHIDAIRANGLTVTGIPGERTVRVKAVSDAAGVAPADLVIVLVGSASTAAAAETVRGLLTDEGRALTLQNGIGNAEALAEVLGPGRVIAGSTYNSAAYVGSGHVLHSNVGETVIGLVDGGVDDRCRRLAAILGDMGFPTEAVGNVMGHVWMKFVLNCALNPVCAATGLRPGEVTRVESARLLLESVLDEIMAVVDAGGIDLSVEDPRAYVLDHGWTRYNRPSMLQHVEAGLEPEIGSLNGALVREAEALGVPAPVNRALSRLVLAIAERHRRRIEAPDLDEAALEAAAAAEPDPWRNT